MKVLHGLGLGFRDLRASRFKAIGPGALEGGDLFFFLQSAVKRGSNIIRPVVSYISAQTRRNML